MKGTINYKSILAVAFLVVIIGAVSTLLQRPDQAQGSVNVGNAYYSTTTTTAFLNHTVLRRGTGSLGSVIITGTGPGIVTIYDATTSDPTLRTRTATTTLASFQTTATPGTYTFDSTYNDGLLVDFTAGVGSTTITYR